MSHHKVQPYYFTFPFLAKGILCHNTLKTHFMSRTTWYKATWANTKTLRHIFLSFVFSFSRKVCGVKIAISILNCLCVKLSKLGYPTMDPVFYWVCIFWTSIFGLFSYSICTLGFFFKVKCHTPFQTGYLYDADDFEICASCLFWGLSDTAAVVTMLSK